VAVLFPGGPAGFFFPQPAKTAATNRIKSMNAAMYFDLFIKSPFFSLNYTIRWFFHGQYLNCRNPACGQQPADEHN
jgi:hypothetical protein